MGVWMGAEVLPSRLQPRDMRFSFLWQQDTGPGGLGTLLVFLLCSPDLQLVDTAALPIFLYIKYFYKVRAWQALQRAAHPYCPAPRLPARTAPQLGTAALLGEYGRAQPAVWVPFVPRQQQHPTDRWLGLI